LLGAEKAIPYREEYIKGFSPHSTGVSSDIGPLLIEKERVHSGVHLSEGKRLYTLLGKNNSIGVSIDDFGYTLRWKVEGVKNWDAKWKPGVPSRPHQKNWKGGGFQFERESNRQAPQKNQSAPAAPDKKKSQKSSSAARSESV